MYNNTTAYEGDGNNDADDDVDDVVRYWGSIAWLNGWYLYCLAWLESCSGGAGGWLLELARMCQHELNAVGRQSLYACWL